MLRSENTFPIFSAEDNLLHASKGIAVLLGGTLDECTYIAAVRFGMNLRILFQVPPLCREIASILKEMRSF